MELVPNKSSFCPAMDLTLSFLAGEGLFIRSKQVNEIIDINISVKVKGKVKMIDIEHTCFPLISIMGQKRIK